MVLSPPVLFDQVNILENGRNIRFLNDLGMNLQEGDIVVIFLPAGGG
jgi:molybdopterin converting factor small subunit